MVVANAPWRWFPAAVRVVAGADLVVAADGGANHLARIGIRPAALVGDFDSVRPGVRRWIGEDRVVLRPDQESSDLDKALTFVLDEFAIETVTVLAATGGRLDHAVENLVLLTRFAARAPVVFLAADARFEAVIGRLETTSFPGQTLSLLPFGECPRVTTIGLHWPLAGERLAPGLRSAVSNRATGDSVVIESTGGALVAVLAAPATGW